MADFLSKKNGEKKEIFDRLKDIVILIRHIRNSINKIQNPSMKVDIFISCCVDQFSPKTAFNLIRLLNNLGVETVYNSRQTCCGQVLYKTGDKKGAEQLGTNFISLFQNQPYIVGCSASCVTYIKSYFEELFSDNLTQTWKTIADKIYDITDFIVNVLKVERLNVSFPHKVVFMDNCTAIRQYKIVNEPRILLKNVRGIQLLKMPEEGICCGYGGMFSQHFEPISSALAKRKIENALSVGAEYIVSTDTACLLHLQSYIDKHKLPIECIHIVDVLAGD